MSQYFLKLPGESAPRPFPEYEVREMLGQGIITPKTLIWTQGMDGWQPVSEVLHVEDPEAPLPEITPPPLPEKPPVYLPYPPAKSMIGLSLAVLILLANMLWSDWIIYSGFTNGNNIGFQDLMTVFEQHINNIPAALTPLVLVMNLMFFPSILLILIRLYRVAANLRALQVQGLRFTPFFCLLFTCMPIIGLLMNALMLLEFYKASANPVDWMTQRPAASVRLLIFCAAALTYLQIFPLSAEYWSLSFYLKSALAIACALMWLTVMSKINANLAKLHRNSEQ